MNWGCLLTYTFTACAGYVGDSTLVMECTTLPFIMSGQEGHAFALDHWSMNTSGDNAATDVIMDDVIQLDAPPISSRYASPKDWEQHKETIRWLYLDQRHTLTKVMEIMREDFGHEGR